MFKRQGCGDKHVVLRSRAQCRTHPYRLCKLLDRFWNASLCTSPSMIEHIWRFSIQKVNFHIPLFISSSHFFMVHDQLASLNFGESSLLHDFSHEVEVDLLHPATQATHPSEVRILPGRDPFRGGVRFSLWLGKNGEDFLNKHEGWNVNWRVVIHDIHGRHLGEWGLCGGKPSKPSKPRSFKNVSC